ncbi:hypothetical protein HO173_007474 [Letharia columbiana]|uniref:Uncharacterized protein n=1 Tax=Letharia columbiana TaxID=112416 RepID=A0A8H6L3R7_9LECA|nr:uncharacterized protein HO173_007474 [Letharia columbiana]KAF6234441.1 hypothetical protein HO173_007474 [Letharia columbiana]
MLFTNLTVWLASSLSLIASAQSVWSAATPVTKFPILPRTANQSTTGVSPASGTKKYFAETFCTPYQKLIEKIAWRDALQYAQSLASWQPNGSFQPAMDLYMGNDSRGQLGATLRANIDGAVRIHDQSTWPRNQRLFVFCSEPMIFVENGGMCGEALAYAFNINGTYYDNHYVVFCPPYYELQTLYKTLSITDAFPLERLLVTSANDFDENQGEIYFHESLHFADLTTPVNHPIHDNNGNEPDIYGPYDVAMEAESKNTAACLHIADAYTHAAAAILIQQRYNLADPPKPRKSVFQRNLGSQANGWNDTFERLPQLPNPNTPDNHIVSNDFGIGPVASSSHQLIPGSSSLSKRVVWPPKFPCTAENRCVRSMAATIATTISGPLICFLVAGLCVLSFLL